jgi:hypothetical protein
MNIDGETKIVQDKPKFKQYLGSNPALQRILKEKLPYKEARKVIIPRKKKKKKKKNNNFTAKPKEEKQTNTHSLCLSVSPLSVCLCLCLSLSLCLQTSKHRNRQSLVINISQQQYQIIKLSTEINLLETMRIIQKKSTKLRAASLRNSTR